MEHLTLRVAWHDNKWNGTICRAPSKNPFCVALDRVREDRKDALEDSLAGEAWDKLDPDEMPPCIFESAGFMSPRAWSRRFTHPYSGMDKTRATHGRLKPTTVNVPPYATFAVPFAWMLKENQAKLDEALPEPLPADEENPLGKKNPWVFGKARQEALVRLMFDRLLPERSLAFFYTKEGHPLGDNIPRLVVGVGRIVSVGKLIPYESDGPNTYPLWDRVIRHSITPDGEDGFLLPYHDYLEPTGDPEEDARRQELLAEIIVAPDTADIRRFSYVSELANSDVALSTLVRCLEAVRKIRAHGIAEGPWERREEWLNRQISATWKERGAFPGLGSALEALGMRLGTALSLELLSSGQVASEADPWPTVDAILRGGAEPPQLAYKPDLEAVRATWVGLDEERRGLLKLLSRFSLTPEQAKRWFDPKKRNRATRGKVGDADILHNPYRIVEVDLGDTGEPPVSMGVVDRGLLPDSTIAARHPVPEPSAVGSPNDPRRIRAALVTVLGRAAERGDSLLSITECLDETDNLRLERDIEVPPDWIQGNRGFLEEEVRQEDVLTNAQKGESVASLQLVDLRAREERLKKTLEARAKKPVPSTGADWKKLLLAAIEETGGKVDEANPRHALALSEQVEALEKITTRRISTLVGRAGTGKTSILGALYKCDQLIEEGVLLLAPTGKARVRLTRVTGAEAKTIAQFLYSLDRYDGARQRPLFESEKRYRKERTVVIDECSMLTMDDLHAVLKALELNHVKRLILVGDPNQLPPIGVGRPFADYVAFLEDARESAVTEEKDVYEALARLTVEVRATAGQPSDTLRLASWFTREQQPVDADRVLSDLELGKSFNDLEICFWKNPDELRTRLLEQFQRHLDLESSGDIGGFNKALGLDERAWIPYENPDGVENFQLLSPVRMHPHGVHEINRWVQLTFRGNELRKGQKWKTALGDEDIVRCDKVIQIRNQRRGAYSTTGEGNNGKVLLANGEIGMVAQVKNGWSNVAFAGRPNLTFGYSGRDFPQGSGPLQLAYALTVHKAQGSDFRKVFVVLPKDSRLISRELLYTALTRSRDQLVLLLEGDDASFLYDLTRPEKSETARRNTNLFRGVVREQATEVPYAEHLIHRTEKGHMVRSKSELVIANMLHHMKLEYEYERVVEGETDHRRLRPDFSFEDAAGDLILWEHLGMLGRSDYRQGWEWKKDWYAKNGYVLGENLFTTEDDANGGLDSGAVREVAEQVAQHL